MKPLALQILVESRSIAVPSRHVLLLCSAADARAIAEPGSKAATSLSCFEQARGLVPDTLSCATKLQEAGGRHHDRAAGNGTMKDGGKRVPLDIKAGDLILFGLAVIEGGDKKKK
ncbi:MAG: hypothetical protein DMF93_17925 [Acidobacteria bacterium]|nr:MAG: hypothetical protein DMF93_17925 [Acidobacteriota bacterium]